MSSGVEGRELITSRLRCSVYGVGMSEWSWNMKDSFITNSGSMLYVCEDGR